MKKLIHFFCFLVGLITIQSCIEPIEFATVSTDTNLVVSATITNEIKTQTIELSRTIPIDSTKLAPETNAKVYITDEAGVSYDFQETTTGVYTSINQFAATTNKQYKLIVETSNGQKYSSTEEALPPTSSINDINVSIENNEIDDIQEFVFKVTSNTSGDEGKFYRYEYDETYQIKTPIWSRKKLLIISDTPPYEFDLVDKTEEEDGIGFCYGNQKSKKILLTETKTLSQDQVIGFPIRQIPVNSYIIGIRYSILVKQYVINQNTFDFYTLLDKFSNPDDIFSQTQVGNIPSNITSLNNSEDKVIGFFEVSSVSNKRIFINRNDITETPFTNYRTVALCDERVNPEIIDAFGRSPLLDRLRTGWIYQSPPDLPIIPPNRLYQLAQKPCGDCSHLGAVNPPDFWTE